MKNTIKCLGIIALVAVIGFSMVSCDPDNGNGNGSGKTYILSLDKIDDSSFTLTIEGGTWASNFSGYGSFLNTFFDFSEAKYIYDGNPYSIISNQIFWAERTSDTVWTTKLLDDYTFVISSSISIRPFEESFSFEQGQYISGIDYDKDKYIAKSGKESITW